MSRLLHNLHSTAHKMHTLTARFLSFNALKLRFRIDFRNSGMLYCIHPKSPLHLLHYGSMTSEVK